MDAEKPLRGYSSCSSKKRCCFGPREVSMEMGRRDALSMVG